MTAQAGRWLRWRRRVLGALGAAVLAAAPVSVAHAAPPSPARPVEVRLMAINGFGGALRPPTENTGGAAYLASYVTQLRGAADAAQLYSTGDNVGDTPFESALFHDEPSIEFLDSLGLTASAIGNHDLDFGMPELRRLQQGGCHPVDGCRFTDTFDGAAFPMIGTDLRLHNGLPATLPFAVSFVGTVPVGTIAITPHDVASRVAPSGITDVTVSDPLETVNRTADLLQFLGVRTIVLLLHEDLHVASDDAAGCAAATGPARPIVDQASPAVDVIFTGGSDDAFTCTFPDPDNRPRAVVQAHPDGTGVSVADVTLDPANGEMLRDRVSTFNQVVRHDIAPQARSQQLVDRAVALSDDAARRPVGSATAPVTREFDGAGEAALGVTVADAQVAAARDAGARIALTNPGGIRADLPAGEITYRDVFAAQPFRNPLHTITLTGTQLRAVLEQQLRTGEGDDPSVTAVMLQPSSGLTYSIEAAAPVGDKIRDIRVDGTPLPPDETVRVTVNAFLAEGGDGFTAFTAGTEPTVGGEDTAALAEYIAGHSPLRPPARGQITIR